MKLGDLPMPEDFRYRDICRRGMPTHDPQDAFLIRHPRMDIGRRAKIFAPFDALRGFGDALASKDEPYVFRRELNEEEQEELSRRLKVLCGLTANSRAARANRAEVTVTYFVPCSDTENEAYGSRGQYRTVCGICMRVDPSATRTVTVGDCRVNIDDILSIDGPGDLFGIDDIFED